MKKKKKVQAQKVMAPLMAPVLPEKQFNKKFKNPLLAEKYMEGAADGYDAGYAEARDKMIAQVAVRVERLEKIPGIGPKRMQQILDAMNEPFSKDDHDLTQEYLEKLRGMPAHEKE